MDTMAVKALKRTLLVILLALSTGSLSSCRSGNDRSDERKHLESVMGVLAQVQNNLSRIRQKEAVVERLSSDMEGAGKKSEEQIGREIYDNIRFIDSTLTASRALVATLEKENRNSAYRVESLDRLTRELKGSIDGKDHELATMKNEISKLNSRIAGLMSRVDVMDEVISDQEERIAEAYYVVGTIDELARKGILRKTVGIEGIIGGEPVLATDFDTKYFRTIDIAETRDLFLEIPVKNVRIVTPHTRASFDLVGGSASTLLLIRDEDEFWRKSRCLVIVKQ